MSNPTRARIVTLGQPPVIISIVVGLALGAALTFAGGWLYITLPRGPLATLLALTAILLGGTALFVFRESHRLYYGALELGAAAAVAVQGMGQVQTPVEGWSAIVAALYLVVRALDNIWKATEQGTGSGIGGAGFGLRKLKNPQLREVPQVDRSAPATSTPRSAGNSVGGGRPGRPNRCGFYD